MYRPTADRRLIHVRVVDSQRAGTIVVVRVYEAESGRFVREEAPRPEDHAPAERDDDRGRPDERPRPRDRSESRTRGETP